MWVKREEYNKLLQRVSELETGEKKKQRPDFFKLFKHESNPCKTTWYTTKGINLLYEDLDSRLEKIENKMFGDNNAN